MPAFVDISGQKFNRLTVVERAGRHACGVITWRCVCECGSGEEVIATAQNLRSENTKSCGCLHREVATQQQKALIPLITTHGMTKSTEYMSYHNMLARCYNPKDKRYAEYAPRGISVCDRWRESFENFLADMGLKPSSKHTLDRIDNDGNYEPGNCRWATPLQQNNNKRTTPMVEYRGRRMSLGDAFRESKTRMSYSGVKARINRGVSVYEALHG